MAIKDELQELAERMNQDPGPISALNAVYHFQIKDLEKMVQVLFHDGSVQVSEAAADSPDCTLIMSESNLLKLLRDDLNATLSFMTGSLKVEGKLGLALKLQEILKQYQE